MLGEVLGHEAANEPGRPEDDNVQLASSQALRSHPDNLVRAARVRLRRTSVLPWRGALVADVRHVKGSRLSSSSGTTSVIIWLISSGGRETAIAQ